ncbi:MAG: TrkA family potassium uptake protein [Thermodesulfobacteriota bacterium]
MKKYAVIGLGKFGFHVAKALYEEGHEVIAVDRDKARVQAVSNHCTQAVVLNATEKDRLQALGLETIDAVIVSTGTQISVSILICLYLQEMGVKKILVKAVDEDHAKVLTKVGASEIVHPEKDMALRVARNLSTPNILDFIPLAEDYNLIEIEPPRAFIGKTLRELNLRAKHNVHIIAIKELVPDRFNLVPPAGFLIKDSDILIMLGKAEDIRKIKALQ